MANDLEVRLIWFCDSLYGHIFVVLVLRYVWLSWWWLLLLLSWRCVCPGHGSGLVLPGGAGLAMDSHHSMPVSVCLSFSTMGQLGSSLVMAPLQF